MSHGLHGTKFLKQVGDNIVSFICLTGRFAG